MRFKIFLAVLFSAGLAVSAALADPGKGKGGEHKGKGKDKGAAVSPVASTSAGTTTSSSSGKDKDKGKGAEKSAEKSHGKGKGSAEQQALACKPVVSLVLKGKLVGAPGASSFAMLVAKSNKHGRALNGKQVTIEVGAHTKVKRRGNSGLSSLVDGDRLVVDVRACKAGEALKLVAKKVVAQPAKGGGDGGDGDDDDTTTTGTTGTTTTGTTSTTTTGTTTTTTSTTDTTTTGTTTGT